MVNTCNALYSYDDRIRILKRYVRSWSSNIERTPTQLHHIDGECIAYELVAGVFVKTDGLSLTIQWLPSPSTDAKQLIRPPEELLIPIKDFALDPTQDLIVMIQADLLCAFLSGVPKYPLSACAGHSSSQKVVKSDFIFERYLQTFLILTHVIQYSNSTFLLTLVAMTYLPSPFNSQPTSYPFFSQLGRVHRISSFGTGELETSFS